MKTFMFTKTHTWNNENKDKKSDLKDKAKQETQKKQKELMKSNFSHVRFWCCCFHETKVKKQGKKKQPKHKEGLKRKQNNKEG